MIYLNITILLLIWHSPVHLFNMEKYLYFIVISDIINYNVLAINENAQCNN